MESILIGFLEHLFRVTSLHIVEQLRLALKYCPLGIPLLSAGGWKLFQLNIEFPTVGFL